MKKDELKDALLKAPPKPPEELLVPQKKGIFGGFFIQDKGYASSLEEIKEYKERLKNSQLRETALQKRIDELESTITANSTKSTQTSLSTQQTLQQNEQNMRQKGLDLEKRFRELYEEKKLLQTKEEELEKLRQSLDNRTKELQQKQETVEREEQEWEVKAKTIAQKQQQLIETMGQLHREEDAIIAKINVLEQKQEENQKSRQLEGTIEERQSQLTKLEQQIHDLTPLKEKLETSISEDHRKFKEETKSVLARLNQLHILEQKLTEKEAFLAKKEQAAKALLAEVEHKGIQQPVYGQPLREESVKPAIDLQQRMVQAKNPQVFDTYAAVAAIKKKLQERNIDTASAMMNELRQKIALTKDKKIKEEMDPLLLELNTDLELAKLS
ncbi:hypothetical protein HYW21_09120 [Candidatus Woesearchaeota archaeon]|nr:hypothetical protein [Candidatus Woesearchaeota archaeon]